MPYFISSSCCSYIVDHSLMVAEFLSNLTYPHQPAPPEAASLIPVPPALAFDWWKAAAARCGRVWVIPTHEKQRGIRLLIQSPFQQRQAQRCFLLSSGTCLSKGGNGATSAPIKCDAAMLGRKAAPLSSILPSCYTHTKTGPLHLLLPPPPMLFPP